MALSSISSLSTDPLITRSQSFIIPPGLATASQKYSLQQFFDMLRSQATSPKELAIINQSETEAQKLFQMGEIGSETAAPSDAVLAWFRIGAGFTDQQGLPKTTGEAISLFESIVQKRIAVAKKTETMDLILYMLRVIFPKKNPHAVSHSKEVCGNDPSKDALEKAADKAGEFWG